MRTKEEILDTIDGLSGQVFRDERQANARRGVGDVAPMAAMIEAMKPFAEAVLDLRDLLAPLNEIKREGLLPLVESWAKNQKAYAKWRQDALGMILAALGDPTLSNMIASRKAEMEKADDADAGEEAPSGHGRTDSHPEEAGQD